MEFSMKSSMEQGDASSDPKNIRNEGNPLESSTFTIFSTQGESIASPNSTSLDISVNSNTSNISLEGFETHLDDTSSILTQSDIYTTEKILKDPKNMQQVDNNISTDNNEHDLMLHSEIMNEQVIKQISDLKTVSTPNGKINDSNFELFEADSTIQEESIPYQEEKVLNESLTDSQWQRFTITDNYFIIDDTKEANEDQEGEDEDVVDDIDDIEREEIDASDYIFGTSDAFSISVESKPSKAEKVIRNNINDLKEKASSAKKKISKITKSIVVAKLDGSRLKLEQRKLEVAARGTIPPKTRFLDPYFYPTHNYNVDEVLSINDVLKRYVVPIMKAKEKLKLKPIETKKTFVFRPLPGIVKLSPASPVPKSPTVSSPQPLPEFVTITRNRSTSVSNVRDNQIKRFLIEAFTNQDDKNREKKAEEVKAALNKVVTEVHHDLNQRELEVAKALRRLKTNRS